MATGPLRLWRTVRWLRPVQVYGRILRGLYRPRPDLRPAPLLRAASVTWLGCARAPSMTRPDAFRFLGVERRIADATDWQRADWPRLWLYNAHYHDDLAADGASARRTWHAALIRRWIAENPPASGVGWEPYPVSMRVVNWIKWALAGNALDATSRQSLAVQVRWLRRRLETHLLGNHLWANAKALVFAGTFFDGSEAGRWLDDGLSLARRELAEQVLPDGGHFELSPMYHAIVLEDLLDLVQLGGMYANRILGGEVPRWRGAAIRMLRWLRVMSHPDGGIAFFNDAALGIAPDLAALDAYAERLGIAIDCLPPAAIEALPDSGYVRLTAGDAVLIADVARIGPDYLPGHAHADTLSFELSVRGKRVLVNGGTSTYGPGMQRLRERGTPMHNTVTVDGRDSSEVWAAFRVARRARPFDVRWGQDDGALWLEGAHDGYLRIHHGPAHRRRWELRPDSLRVIDTLEGRCSNAIVRFRFAPGAEARVAWKCEDAARAEASPGAWHPRFGATEPCQVLEACFSGTTLTTEFRWTA